MTDLLRHLLESGALSEADVRLGSALSRVSGQPDSDVEILGALVSRSARDGHVCFTAEQVQRELQQQVAALLESVRSPVVGDGNSVTPLVRDGARLYVHRSFEREHQLAQGLRARARVHTDLQLPSLRASLDRLFDADPSDPRRLAALRAFESRLLVITGGPGTGKTTTVVRLLAFLIEAARAENSSPPRISLLAPTGKAAARLAESIRGAVRGLETDPWTLSHLPSEAKTVHRALGLGTRGRARFDESHPWSADVVIVDEASMVDLELMHRILAATRPEARLILLGDPNQLSSVEAGSVLADLALGRNRFRQETLSRMREFGVSDFVHDPAATELDDSVIELTVSHRYESASGIGTLARSILAGDRESVFEVLSSADDVVWKESVRDGLLTALLDNHRLVTQVREPLERHQRLREHRVVCARRAGAFGVADLNRRVRRALDSPTLGSFEGLPLFVRRNDPSVDLFNGDVGVVSGSDVWFEHAGSEARPVPLALVPPHDDAFAMTVHQSQGSEFQTVSVVLADADSQLASRELLYTAVTRARTRVVLYALRKDIAAAVDRRAFRDSGLVERLRAHSV